MVMSEDEVLDRLAGHCFPDLRECLDGVVSVENLFRRFHHQQVIVERDEQRVMRASGESLQQVNIVCDLLTAGGGGVAGGAASFSKPCGPSNSSFRGPRVDLQVRVFDFLNRHHPSCREHVRQEASTCRRCDSPNTFARSPNRP